MNDLTVLLKISPSKLLKILLTLTFGFFNSIGVTFHNEYCNKKSALVLRIGYSYLTIYTRQIFKNYETAKLGIFQYIEGFYNRKSIHGSIGYRIPIQVYYSK